jgi:hydroxymethylbilane synthase
VPLAVYARVEAEELAVDALVGSPDGTEIVRSARRGAPEAADALAEAVAAELLERGAGAIIARLAADRGV